MNDAPNFIHTLSSQEYARFVRWKKISIALTAIIICIGSTINMMQAYRFLIQKKQSAQLTAINNQYQQLQHHVAQLQTMINTINNNIKHAQQFHKAGSTLLATIQTITDGLQGTMRLTQLQQQEHTLFLQGESYTLNAIMQLADHLKHSNVYDDILVQSINPIANANTLFSFAMRCAIKKAL